MSKEVIVKYTDIFDASNIVSNLTTEGYSFYVNQDESEIRVETKDVEHIYHILSELRATTVKYVEYKGLQTDYMGRSITEETNIDLHVHIQLSNMIEQLKAGDPYDTLTAYAKDLNESMDNYDSHYTGTVEALNDLADIVKRRDLKSPEVVRAFKLDPVPENDEDDFLAFVEGVIEVFE